MSKYARATPLLLGKFGKERIDLADKSRPVQYLFYEAVRYQGVKRVWPGEKPAQMRATAPAQCLLPNMTGKPDTFSALYPPPSLYSHSLIKTADKIKEQSCRIEEDMAVPVLIKAASLC